ncbi:MAG TPA: hypothetical protein VML19_03955 [Verrucomicrobiae bacterium]|nr:hypothetical protein [Verrucomicrobiae bacterium]
MRFTRLVSAALLAGGLALGGSPADDSAKPNGSKSVNPAAPAEQGSKATPTVPPVLQTPERDDTTFVVLPGASNPPQGTPAATENAATPPETPGPPPLPPPDPERPLLHRGEPAYPAEFGEESAIFCQDQIGVWMEGDAISLLGEPKHRRPSMSDEGTENGDILAFSDPSSRYREIELDFDRETGTLRTVFAYPWKMTWLECRKVWGTHVSVADADKGRTFYSYLDHRLDVLVDSGGKVISLGLY